VGSDAISEVAKGAGVGVAFGRVEVGGRMGDVEMMVAAVCCLRRVEVGGGMGDVEMMVAAVCCLRRAGFSHYNSIV
jgi:hypothetical protein